MGAVLVSPGRYQVRNPSVIPQGFVDNKKASELLLGALGLDTNEYKIGHIKVGPSHAAPAPLSLVPRRWASGCAFQLRCVKSLSSLLGRVRAGQLSLRESG